MKGFSELGSNFNEKIENFDFEFFISKSLKYFENRQRIHRNY